MIARDLVLPPGTRLVHPGAHKTGTTAVQGAFHQARSQLAEHGASYFGPNPGFTYLEGALAVSGKRAQLGKQIPDLSTWTALARDIAAEGDRRVLVSSAFFGDGDEQATGRVVDDLSQAGDVHILITLRPLTKIIGSQWQQFVQNGLRLAYPDWLDGILNKPPAEAPTPAFWQRHRHDRLVGRWAAAAGAANITVVIVDETDRLMLLRTFEAMLGLPDGLLELAPATSNRSLTLGEVELIRLINEEAKRLDWPDKVYSRLIRGGVVNHLKNGYQPGPGEQRIVTPPWALKRTAEIGAEMATAISALGVRVIGDLTTLGELPEGSADMGPDAPQPEPVVPSAAAARAVLGTIVASKLPAQFARTKGGQPAARPKRPEDRLVREVDAKTLAGVLARRGWRRARRTLRNG